MFPYTWPELLALLFAAGAAGLMRGFAGFGAALVFTPLASTIIEPWRAVVLLVLMEAVLPLPLLPAAWRTCNKREALPFTLAAAVMVPAGSALLVTLDPTLLRWVLSCLALVAVVALASGWHYQGKPSSWLSAGVGAVTGFIGGTTSFFAPPLAVFWLAGQSSGPVVRANINIFFVAIAIVASASYALLGVLTWLVLLKAAILMPVFAIMLYAGVRLHRVASERSFRIVAYLVITTAAITALPIYG
ncbi:MAG: sulfite exporter TauE/SafE family protein [Pseudomonadota bacterium]